MPQRTRDHAEPEAGSSSRPTSGASFRPFGRPLPERTAPAITREAPWIAFNATTVPQSAEGPHFGPNRFVLGANVPWIQYGLDFGMSSGRPEGGLHVHPEDAALLRQVFARLQADGVAHARLFVLCDGRAGVRFAEDGTPESLDGAVFADLDVVMNAARETGIGLILVLLDGDWLVPTELADGCLVGGHADTIREGAKRAALLERVLRPLLIRYADDAAVMAWEVMYAPERRTLGLVSPVRAMRRPIGGWMRAAASRAKEAVVRRLVGFGRSLGLVRERVEPPSWVEREQMRTFLGEAVDLIHRHTRALATVGIQSTANLDLVRGLGLDFYLAAWAPDHGDEALRRAVSDLQVDRPLLLGAFPGSHPHKSIKTVLDTARCAGYGGAFVWSVLRHDALSGYDGQLGQWSKNHTDQLHHREPPAEAAAAEHRAGGEADSQSHPAAPLVVQR
jgi:hypothetical protein